MGSFKLSICLFLYIIVCVLSSPIENDTEEFVKPDYLDQLWETKQYTEFMRLLHIGNIERVNQSTELIHSDVIYRPWQIRQPGPSITLSRYSIMKWPNNVVPYSISRNSFIQLDYFIIVSAIRNWNNNIQPVKFRPRRSTDKDYILFFNGHGCFSNLGKAGGQQPISLESPGCINVGTIYHEMMHTLGILHEHERPDRDKYIKIYFNNIPRNWHSQYQKSSIMGHNQLGEYDYYSIMHYSLLAPGTSKLAFTVLKRNVNLQKIGQRRGLTAKDKRNIMRLYSKLN